MGFTFRKRTPTVKVPQRGDAFERWLWAQSRAVVADYPKWAAIDDLIEAYRDHADTHTPLDQPLFAS